MAVLAAVPALAHPGHGPAGWLHHGEGLWVAVVIGTLLGARIWRAVSGRPDHRGR